MTWSLTCWVIPIPHCDWIIRSGATRGKVGWALAQTPIDFGLKPKLLCDRCARSVRMLVAPFSMGTWYQLPVLSGFSDAVWVQRFDPYLQMYSHGTDCCADWFYATQISHVPFFYNPYMVADEYRSLMDGADSRS